MRFGYLFIISFLVSIILGRIIVSDQKIHTYLLNRLMFIVGVLSGLILFLFIKHISTEEILLQFITIIIGAFLGSLIISTRNSSLIENYDDQIKNQTTYFKKQFNNQGFTEISEPYDKRVFDLVVSLIGLILLSPVYLIAGILIWLEDPGAILFAKRSVGKGGFIFMEYKFRTMIKGSATGPIESKKSDKRLLRIGSLLRKIHLDEFPQLFNVLKGEMSLVGPRPLRTIDEYEYNQLVNGFMQRHQVLPGITGLAQIRSGYHATPENRLKEDIEYIKYRKFFLDIKILFSSIIVIFRKKSRN